jgi:hypothetical protein
MKERPILFSAPMVRALLAGTKTQTRRVVKITHRTPGLAACLAPPAGMRTRTSLAAELCPYGHPGDRLWVRESWSPDPPDVDGWGYTAWAGCREGQIAGVPERFRYPRFCNYAADWLHGPIRWTPSIHMPRWASRITLEITSVRVERLQEISEADAQAEGWTRRPEVSTDPQVHKEAARDWFMDLWESINGPGSWDANPWVWVIEFRRLA